MNRYMKIAMLMVVSAALGAIAMYSFGMAGEDGKMLGLVVADENVDLEVAKHPGEADRITVDRVLAPGDSWVVVHLDEGEMPGPKIGITRVEKGVSRDVVVDLEPKFAPDDPLLVVLHGDRGIQDTFEFDMEYFEKSPDKPYFVDGEKVKVMLE